MSLLDRTNLRSLQAEDLEAVLAWRNHPDVRRFMYTQHTISLEEHRRWFEKAHGDDNKRLLLFELEGEATGFVNLSLVDPQASRADWGFYLAPQAPKGSGRQLGTLALAYAYETMHVHKLCGEALAFNVRSIRFHERLGFRREAWLRDHHFDGSDYHDVVGFGLLRSEWLRQQGHDHYANT
ncbi:UDP-4-amino-4,6-dideoxy-N-acetyl-beta-L-altrosamine N-acetyltransferase [Modicisalibacter xianhensis]|uniref:UDP-4-amino-4, 6-dideoxy-N-acetyl-beta-L-altrosamine N-acetyltransferase n=1 Tax=Modicisalibacter xianhensis TaxID=442341 RepID=A0A4R8FYK1_9GAMM|nr:UDP-4-amino-4,6-dideoxy-N-acetyl-beta-L-altrosamine N-acetyltransferase [Halomonas xianhensis]TDX32165.1 UDP-4-amino-4,6-dideoxy-N-acetyl-beta-L-altrosamine N-acetyltransferase [Halomonas xianhensis]